MKKQFLFLTTILFSVLFTACKKDDGDVARQNGFTYNGKFYATPDLLFEPYSNGDASLIFISDNYTVTNDGLSGTDIDVVYLDFEYDETKTLVQEGTYVYNEDDTTLNTFYGGCYIDYNTTTDVSTKDLESTGGTVTLTKSGDVYTADYTINTSEGTVTGYYNGTITRTLD